MCDHDGALVDLVELRQAFEQDAAVLRVPVRVPECPPRGLDRAGKRAEMRLVRVEPGDPRQTELLGASRRRQVGRVREEPRVVEARRRRGAGARTSRS
jgi:hypothetical protein